MQSFAKNVAHAGLWGFFTVNLFKFQPDSNTELISNTATHSESALKARLLYTEYEPSVARRNPLFVLLRRVILRRARLGTTPAGSNTSK